MGFTILPPHYTDVRKRNIVSEKSQEDDEQQKEEKFRGTALKNF
jgi:hypothetical protein